jgi:hypothetical protein
VETPLEQVIIENQAEINGFGIPASLLDENNALLAHNEKHIAWALPQRDPG